ncbi:unnamed protein product [Didymodactylos carnosus]|uniref:Fibronectin type III-like domain-containing protein n=1 Tax=Didymodactylos carnosus TaxID=1234261 RepID=A0A8S2RVB9_9BILA|nr:unnamed protein product [Didymodactylos carnosus]CAF4190445.1 unnamed protein product [Didymodactylos carnosus]
MVQALFDACVNYGQVMSIMCSYNAINNIPTCGNPDLLNGILRERWNFTGFVVKLLTDDGNVTMDTLNNAVRRLLKTKIELGMFDPPNMVEFNSYDFNDIENEAHLKLARQVAQQSICLYKNTNNNLQKAPLPIQNSAINKIGLFGIQSVQTDLLLGNYARSPDQPGITTILQGIYDQIDQNTTANCTFEQDIGYFVPGQAPIAVYNPGQCCALCSTVQTYQSMESEGRDRSTIDLPVGQYELVRLLKSVIGPNKSLIGILIRGGSIALHNLMDDCDGLIDGWYPGQLGGAALADVIFGSYNPAGRTPVTYYHSDEQLPPMHVMDLYPNSTISSLGITYRYFTGKPQIPFGFGLSYTTFSYANLQVKSSNVKACDLITGSVDVTNTGAIDGDEVIQIYIKYQASVPSPNVRLVSFQRILVQAGHTVTMEFTITPDYHAVIYDSDSVYKPTRMVEEGTLNIYAGGGQPDYYSGHLQQQVQITNTQNIDTC